jgi:hypothetical protein
MKMLYAPIIHSHTYHAYLLCLYTNKYILYIYLCTYICVHIFVYVVYKVRASCTHLFQMLTNQLGFVCCCRPQLGSVGIQPEQPTWHFLLLPGLTLFVAGAYINISADHSLRRLRTIGDKVNSPWMYVNSP